MSAHTTAFRRPAWMPLQNTVEVAFLKQISLSLSSPSVRSVFFPSPFDQTRTFLFLPLHAAPRPFLRPLLDRFLAAQLLIFLLSPLFSPSFWPSFSFQLFVLFPFVSLATKHPPVPRDRSQPRPCKSFCHETSSGTVIGKTLRFVTLSAGQGRDPASKFSLSRPASERETLYFLDPR